MENKILPLFKTEYSIGKSILTIKPSKEKAGADDVLSIAQEANLKEVTLIEDGLEGFRIARKTFKEAGIKLNYGLSIFCADKLPEDSSDFVPAHKIILMLKESDSDESASALIKFFSDTSTRNKLTFPITTLDIVKEHWDSNIFELHIPFYDSFLHKNCVVFGSSFMPSLAQFGNVTFHVQENGVAEDGLIRDAVEAYVKDCKKCKVIETKSIFYKNKEDFEAWQVFKIITGRSSSRGGVRTLDAPEMDSCRSDRFSWEAFLEDSSKKTFKTAKLKKSRLSVDNFNKFVIFDLETESLNLRCKAWQGGFIVADHAKVLKQEESWIWHPDLRMSKGAAIATKFDQYTYEKYANPKNNPNGLDDKIAYYPKDWYEMFAEYLFDDKCGIVFQNGLGFDIHVLGSLAERAGYKADFSYLRRSFDTASIERGILHKSTVDLDNFLEFQLRHNSLGRKIKGGVSLQALVKRYGIKYDPNRHHVEALYDCELTLEVFNQQKRFLKD